MDVRRLRGEYVLKVCFMQSDVPLFFGLSGG
jgi:hypothetical protein